MIFIQVGNLEILDLDICFITNVFSCMASRNEQQISVHFAKVDLSDVGVRDHLNQSIMNNAFAALGLPGWLLSYVKFPSESKREYNLWMSCLRLMVLYRQTTIIILILYYGVFWNPNALSRKYTYC